MQRTLGLAAIAVLAAFPPSAMAQQKVEISPDEIRYLCDVVNHFFKKQATPAYVV